MFGTKRMITSLSRCSHGGSARAAFDGDDAICRRRRHVCDDPMLTVLGGLAEFERDLIRARTGGEAVREIARSYNVRNSTISRLVA